MSYQKVNYYSLSKVDFLTKCARNIILRIPKEQDELLIDYCDEVNGALIHYIHTTTNKNLDMLYNNLFEFSFKLTKQGNQNIFNMKFDYYD